MSNLVDSQYFFDKIQDIWKSIKSENRVIPFCTPIQINPDVLVIGKNHSNNFCPYNQSENNRIANSFAKKLPLENTFLKHQHPFAEGIKRVMKQLKTEFNNFDVTERWVGTNRCAIQTNSKGLGEIYHHPNFRICQHEMDLLLKNFIKIIKPKNVILSGKDACELFYIEKRLVDMNCKKFQLDQKSKQTCNIIPLEHFSLNYNTQKILDRLRYAIINNFFSFK